MALVREKLWRRNRCRQRDRHAHRHTARDLTMFGRGHSAVRRTPDCSRTADAGSATILAAVGAAAMLVILAVGLQVTGAVIARHRAEAAADLAALAGATEVLSGLEAACGQAASIAAANGGRLDDCELLGLDLRITVQIAVSIGPIGTSATGRARAGPVDF